MIQKFTLGKERVFVTCLSMFLLPAGSAFAQTVFIPDPNFKAALVSDASINTNGDGEIQVSEAEAVTGTVKVNGKGIASLTGIEAFVNMTQLKAQNNNLSAVDLSANIALKKLHLQDNQLTSIDVDENQHLDLLRLQNNQLTSLDVSTNAKLEYLEVQHNALTSLNVQNGNNDDMYKFDARHNPDLSCVQVDDVAYAEGNFTSVDGGVHFSEDCGYAEPVVYIPDANFKEALLADGAINTNGDEEIQVSEAEQARYVNVAGQGISDLTGIEAFTDMYHLNCSDNNLTELDLSSNLELLELNCSSNELTKLVLPSKIEYLNCEYNELAYLDLYNLRVLRTIECSFNQLTSLDLSRANMLWGATANNNQLNFINAKNGHNTEMYEFEAMNNPDLTCVQVDHEVVARETWARYVDPGVQFSNQCDQEDVDIVLFYDRAFKNVLLTNYEINTNMDNEIQVMEANSFSGEINISSGGIYNVRGIETFTSLTSFVADDNHLTTLSLDANPLVQNISVENNDLQYLSLKNRSGSSVSHFSATGNSDLECVQVDDPGEWSGGVDPGTSFHTDCGPMIVTIPDALLLDRLVNKHPVLDINKDDLVQVHEAEAYAGMIDVTDHLDVYTFMNVDPTGIEAFTEATGLQASMLGLESLDVSMLSELTFLDVSSNRLTTLNIQNGNNENLTTFRAYANSELVCIQVDDVGYAEANWRGSVSAGTSFSTNCDDGPTVYIPDPNFKAALLADAAINTNGDGEIQVSEAEAFAGSMKVNGQGISDLTGIEAFVNLFELKAHYNNLTTVDLRANTSLVKLHLQVNDLAELDLSANTELDMLRVQVNKLIDLDMSANTKLRYLEVQNNALVSLNVKNGNNTAMYKFEAEGNYNLTCIEVDDAAYAASNWSDDVDAGASFSEDCSVGGARIAMENAYEQPRMSVAVYPNPTSDFLKISTKEAPDALQLFSINGDLMNVRFEKGEADIRHLKKGIYILKASQGKESFAVRIMKE